MSKKYSIEDAEWLEIAAKCKWPQDESYSCLVCGNKKYSEGKSPFSRKCSKCKYEESVISGTVFHGMKLPISKAMAIFESLMLSTNEYMEAIFANPKRLKKFQEDKLSIRKGYLRISSTRLAREHKIQQKTAWSFLNKIMACLDNQKYSEEDIERLGGAYSNFKSWYKWIRVERTAGYYALFMLVVRSHITDFESELEVVLKDLINVTHGKDE